jgi:N-acyl-phosphatidylethanolamine-hydrolysing phospholipase D
MRDVLRWQLQRLRAGIPATPPPGSFPAGVPRIAGPLAAQESTRVTWIGHSSFLIQLPDHNLLTDPVWSDRVSPVRRMGPRRMTPPGLPFPDLPPIHTVLISHDHYDHLDEPTVRSLHDRFGAALSWVTPLNYAPWFARRGIRNIRELDWWEETRNDGVTIRALPARHWTQRSVRDAFTRLWSSFSVRHEHGTRIYFGGDSGYGPFYKEIAAREDTIRSPYDVVMLPIGAYAPKWFMRPAHMDPEEAVLAYRDLGASGAFVPMHWGTFRLADDPPLEPPVRLRAAWAAAGLPPQNLIALRHGDTASFSLPTSSLPTSPA